MCMYVGEFIIEKLYNFFHLRCYGIKKKIIVYVALMIIDTVISVSDMDLMNNDTDRKLEWGRESISIEEKKSKLH